MFTNSLIKVAQLCVSLSVLIATPSAGRAADLMSDWSTKALAIGTEKQLPNTAFTRGLAMMHLAMFEAVNATERRYAPYKLDLSADKATSKEIAAATAAYEVLVKLFPDQKGALDHYLVLLFSGGARRSPAR